jgi:EmrB/QacA subfamily drug resistance transporter
MPNPRFLAMIVASALIMEQIDSTVLATALPTMARSFHVPPLEMGMALTSYLMSLAVFIPASGAVADRYGSRTVFRAAIVIFTLSSIACSQAPTLLALIAARIVQGLGGAMMVPVARLVLVRAVPKSELVSAMSWLLVPTLIGPVIGPPLGGIIVTYLSWPWIFYINVPIGLVGFVLVTLYVGQHKEAAPGPFDVWGLALSGVSLCCLTFALEMGSHSAISGWYVVVLLATGLSSGWIYIRHARVHPRPVLDLRLLRIPTFRFSIVSGTLFRIGIQATPFLLPMMMQVGFGLSPARSGLITFSSAAGSMLMKSLAPRFLRRFGFRQTMLWNGVLSCVLFAVFAAFRPDWPVLLMYAVLLAGGFFRSLQFTAYGTIAYADIPDAKISAATSFFSTIQQLSASLGIATGAATLGLSMTVLHHSQPLMSDFSNAFLVVAVVSFLSIPGCARLSSDAGAEMTRRQPRKATDAAKVGARVPERLQEIR